MTKDDAERWAKEKYGPLGFAREEETDSGKPVYRIGFVSRTSFVTKVHTRGFGYTWEQAMTRAENW